MYCSKCGKILSDSGKFCQNCGQEISSAEYSRQADRKQNYYAAPQTQPTKTNALALTGFILGCVSLIFNLWGIVGLAALVLSVIGYNQISAAGENGKGFATAGIILGAVGILWGIITVFLIGSVFSFLI